MRAVLLYASCVALGVLAAAHWIGMRLGSAAEGSAAVRIGDFTFFPPWAAIQLYRLHGETHAGVFAQGVGVITAAAAIGGLLSLAAGGDGHRVPPFGSHEWARLTDIRRAGLLTRSGVVVGRFAGRLLTFDGPEHQLCTGATRSGKGIGTVIPTALNWTHSAVILDVKREIWEASAGYRGRFSHCFFFDPTRNDSARFNPLAEVRRGENELRDVQVIVEALSDPSGQRADRDIWDLSGMQLLTGLILHVLYTEPDDRKNLAVVRERLLDIGPTLLDMQQVPHRLDAATGQPEPHPEVARIARELQTQAPKFAAGVRATAASWLNLFADDLIRRNTAVSDFCIGDLVAGDCPVTLYLQPPPSDLPRLRPLVRLLLRQICQSLLEDLTTDNRGRRKQHRLLLLLDEFASLGRLEFLNVALRQMAGFGIKALLVVQSLLDLVQIYGPHQTIADNCRVLTAFASADPLTAQKLSQLAGTATEYRLGYSRKRHWLDRHTGSVSHAEQVRPLMPPGDIRELPPDEQLVFVTGCPPIRAGRVRYFADREFRDRVRPAPSQFRWLDIPNRTQCDARLGVPSDWRGVRPAGHRLQSDQILTPAADDDEWAPPPDVGSFPAPPEMTVNTTNNPEEDPYAL